MRAPKTLNFSFTGKITAICFITMAASSGIGIILAHLTGAYVFSWLAGVSFGLIGISLVLQRWLAPQRNLMVALRNGLESFADLDFSTSIAAQGHDELTELARAQNRLGDVMRRERQSLYQRELLLDTVMQSAPTALVLCNQNGHIIYSNYAARELLDSGAPINGRLLSSCLENIPDALKMAFFKRTNGLVVIDDHEQNTYHLTVSQFNLNAQRHTLFLVKRLTQELNRQEVEVWKKVIRLISHELNNSLAPISSLAHSGKTLGKNVEADTLMRIFDTIEDRSTHLKLFIERYAEFARLPKPQYQNVKLREFFLGVKTLIEFNEELENLSESWRFDPAQIEQVLINLLKNAHESGSEKSEIRLTATCKVATLHITVEDRGKGMTERVFANALLPFYSTKQNGTGLGLPLCREIVDAHGGQLSIAARQKGGVRISVHLPLTNENM